MASSSSRGRAPRPFNCLTGGSSARSGGIRACRAAPTASPPVVDFPPGLERRPVCGDAPGAAVRLARDAAGMAPRADRSQPTGLGRPGCARSPPSSASQAQQISVDVVNAIGAQLPELVVDPESFEANRASTEASILGFAHILEQGSDPQREPWRPDARLRAGRRAARRPAYHPDPQLPARSRRVLGTDREADRCARYRPRLPLCSPQSCVRRGCSRMSMRRCARPRTTTAVNASGGREARPRRGPRRSASSSPGRRSTRRSRPDGSATSSTASTSPLSPGSSHTKRGATRTPQ